MTKTIIYIGIVLTVCNLLAGLLLSSFGGVNLAISTLAIVITVILILLVQNMRFRNGFKVSLSFILPVIGLVQYLLAVIMPCRIEDNGYLIVAVALLIVEVIILIATNQTSNKAR